MNNLQALVGSSAVPVEVGNFLFLRVTYTIVNPLALILRALILDENGTLTKYQETIHLDTAAQSQDEKYPLPNGLVLSASLSPETTPLTPGTVFGQLGILYNLPATEPNIQWLTTGYVSGNTFLAFPYSTPAGLTSETSEPTETVSTPPAAGADITEGFTTQPSNTLIAFIGVFTASAAVALRRVTVNYDVESNTQYNFRTRTDITGGQTWRIMGWKGPNMPSDDATAHYMYFPIPDMLANVSFIFSTSTANIQAADQWNPVTFITSHQQ